MQIKFFGANCLAIKLPQISIVFDDNLKDLGGQPVSTTEDIVCLTNVSLIDHLPKAKIIFDTPGDYEVKDILINGIRASSFTDGEGQYGATIFRLIINGLVVIVSGHVAPKLGDEQLESLGSADILFIPVGGGQTLDAVQASQLVKDLSPKMVIPTHYEQKGLNFSSPQSSYEEFIKQLGLEPEFVKDRTLKLKPGDLTDKMRLMIFV